MERVILVVHLLVAVVMVILVLLQKSEGAGLAGPSGGGMMPVRGTGNVLTRATAVMATIFFVTSITLTIMAGGHRQVSLSEQIANDAAAQAPVSADPATPTPAETVPPVSQ